MRNKLSIKAEQLMLKEEISNHRDILSIWRMRQSIQKMVCLFTMVII